jgi:hypothetical protein
MWEADTVKMQVRNVGQSGEQVARGQLSVPGPHVISESERCPKKSNYRVARNLFMGAQSAAREGETPSVKG